jgi:long-subunit fatty acid transport protein
MLLAVQFALGASLDNLEVGGAWGSPLATDATAVWWNPAGLAAGEGTRFLLEVAPTYATVTYDRAEPHGGTDILKLQGAVPYLGVASDFGVDGLGIGLSMAVPFVRGGVSSAEAEASPFPNGVGTGPGHFALRDGMVRALWFTLAGAYEVDDRVAFGGGVSLVRSSWSALVDSDTLPDLDAAIRAEGEDPGYTDADLENPSYAAVLHFSELSDMTASFSAGVQVKAGEQVRLGLAYVHGAAVTNTGAVEIDFGCPPQSDTIGRFGVEDLGLCYASVPAQASVGYTLPGRLHGGVEVTPTDSVAIQALGGWVHWSVFEDYDINIHGAEIEGEEAQDLVNQRRTWARANQDSFWGGLDVKGEVGRRVTLGGRALYDRAAVPDAALSPNNYDADEVLLSGLAAVRVVKGVEVGVSYTHHFVQTRTVPTSGYAMTLATERAEDRWYYPQSAGTYAGTIDRLGLSLRGGF